MSVGSSGGFGNELRILQRWDLSGLDTGAGVASATLTMRASRARGADTVHLFALKSANGNWKEGTGDQDLAEPGEATWNSQRHDANDGGLAWADGEPGAGPSLSGALPPEDSGNDSYYARPIASFTFEDDDDGALIEVELSGAAGLGDGSLTVLIESWKGLDNPGFVMLPESGPRHTNRDVQFFTSEAGNAEDRPELRVTLAKP